MRTVAIVPARGGSKGVPRKNLRRIGGRSLVGWAVLAGLEAKLVDDVVVSSDDPEILQEAVRCGAKPLPRPDELATDEAPTDAVLVHAMSAMGWHHDLVVLLQPTVPVRARGLVDAAIQRLIDTDADSVFTARRLHFVWQRRFRPTHSGEMQIGPFWQSNCKGERIRRQDFTLADERFEEDGAVFVCRAKLLATTRCRVGGDVEILEAESPIDIDTEMDLRVANALLMN